MVSETYSGFVLMELNEDDDQEDAGDKIIF